MLRRQLSHCGTSKTHNPGLLRALIFGGYVELAPGVIERLGSIVGKTSIKK